MDSAAVGPLARYRHLIEANKIQPDPAQQRMAEHLQTCFNQVVQKPQPWWLRWRKRPTGAPGLYLHGQVGRGKTMLMDLLANSLNDAGIEVWRIHFHRFMDHVHDQLRTLDQQRDPLKQVAEKIAQRARVLCFDEFHVSDIGDAMILGELLKALLARHVVLVATSNTAPEQLYADGLQRARFLPAIAAIERHCRIHELMADEDYRLRELVRHPVYYWPANEQTDQALAEEFQALATGERISSEALKIRGHTIKPLKRAGSLAWFDFATLCEGPRATADYIELARRFGTLVVSRIPQLSEDDNNAARRLVHLVDECYDRAVKLIISADVPPESLYDGQRLSAMFERTRSRLIEMQSRDYLSLPHKP
jgi:cell division protein ZapE